jgi:LDH2 family malate/lactate/ureidoglycolate dehydrogenase
VSDPRIAQDRLVRFAAAVLAAVGVKPDHAEITAARLVEADVRGRTGHGLIRLGPYVQRIEAGGVNLSPEIQVLRETPVSALIDGDNAMGQVVMTQATELAIEKAEAVGMAWVGTVHSNHAGAAGIYPAMAAERGLISMYFAVANANGMPPWGGNEPVLGTNPIAIAIPAADGQAFQLDIATTVASHGTIKVAAQAGEEMPVGWVIDAEGKPITDPSRAHEGFLMPIGGYKGAGLNIAIGLLAGTLNGAAFGKSVIDHRLQLDTPTNTGQAIFVMRADLLGERADVEAAMTAQLDELRNSGSASGEPLRLPGDRAAEVIADNTANGIALPEPLRGQLDDLAERLGIDERLR